MERGRQEGWWGKSQTVLWFSGNCNQAHGESLNQSYRWKKPHISQKWALISASWCSSLVGSSPGKHGDLGTCLPGNFSLDHVGNNQEPRIHSSLEPAGEYGCLSMFMSRHFTMKEGGRSRKRAGGHVLRTTSPHADETQRSPRILNASLVFQIILPSNIFQGGRINCYQNLGA